MNLPPEPAIPFILPRPVEMTLHDSAFLLRHDTCIIADPANLANAHWLAEFLGLSLRTHPEDSQNAIRLQTGGEAELVGQHAEGYLLDVTQDGILLRALQPAGVFHGLQSLRQLLPPDLERRAGDDAQPLNGAKLLQVPCLHIGDYPRFAWRGFMLDEGRHFHGKETVLKYLDLLALQKLNVFHWHLTEDQGWRLQIQQYPRLAEVGAWRSGSARGFIGKVDSIPYSGFYTQEDIREIVAYASSLHIQVIPEIDMPGHSLAALAAYPEYGCKGGPYQVARKWGIFPELYCPGREQTFTFLQNILAEVIDLFPSPFIHLGGDETPTRRWKACPDCQQRIRNEHLGNEAGLKVYFMNRIAAWLGEHGRTPIGYSEVLGAGLAQNYLLQYWVGKPDRFMAAMRQGRQVIMSTYLRTYLDHSYALTPLSQAYAYDPLSPDLDAGLAAQVPGLEALLWSEFVPNRARLDYQVFPRLCAFAETGWTPASNKEYADFINRLGVFEERLELLGVAHAHRGQVEPPWLERLLGMLTIARAQKNTAG
jgi:hexosaminidase